MRRGDQHVKAAPRTASAIREAAKRGDYRAPKSAPVPLASILPDVLAEHGVLRQVRRAEVVDLWPDMVGEHVARVTRATGVDEATLFVEVRSSAWLMELNMMKGDFLQRVNERLEDVPLEKIVFVLAETQ
jgi:predicted nucleic acid-binding Zn ribbon protein